MTKEQENKITNIVQYLLSNTSIKEDAIKRMIIKRYTSLPIDESMDILIMHIGREVLDKKITEEQIQEIIPDLTSIYPEKFSTYDDLYNRFKWLQRMNLEYAQMTLMENHQIIIEMFDKFNELLNGNFDCYYTGGIVGYLATNHSLERYHSDLDLLFNENDLEKLYKLIEENEDFNLEGDIVEKDAHGHEFKITYKNMPITIGLFLFERSSDEGLITKDYHYELDEDDNLVLYVDEHHYTNEYTTLAFSDTIRTHNGFPYKMQSLEAIYNNKKNGRAKDEFDLEIIKDQVDMLGDYLLDVKKRNNYDVKNKNADDSVAKKVESMIENRWARTQK